jgi:hypothetical protein
VYAEQQIITIYSIKNIAIKAIFYKWSINFFWLISYIIWIDKIYIMAFVVFHFIIHIKYKNVDTHFDYKI